MTIVFPSSIKAVLSISFYRVVTYAQFMDMGEEIQAHVLSVWKEKRGFFSGKGSEGMLILTNKRLLFIKKTEAPMKMVGCYQN